jgi:hypothetical protein
LSLKIEYDPGLVEQAINHIVHKDHKLEAELHRWTDPVYGISDTRERDAKFIRAYGDFFEKLALDGTLRRLLDERPAIAESIGCCRVGPVFRVAQEGAELLVRNEQREVSRVDRMLVVQISPATLADPALLAQRMRPELIHIADMVDPAFCYERQQIEGLPARQNLVKDRYRVLWDVYVEGRLAREGRVEETNRSKLAGRLARVFGIDSPERASLAIESLSSADSLTHQQLFAWANDPDGFRERETDQPESSSAAPGGDCPLCGFSTFDWFEFDSDTDEILVQTIVENYPEWTPAAAACRQCAEIYTANPTQHPATS